MDDKKMAQMLRKIGLSYSEINEKLSKKRAKSTLSLWCRDIPISETDREGMKERSDQKLVEARRKSVEVRKARRATYLNEIDQRNSGIDGVLSDRVARKAILGALYLAEGTKRPNGSLIFGNSDPRIIRLYLYLLRTCFEIDESKFRCTVQARADSPIGELERFWAKETAIPLEQFYKARIDKRTIGKPSEKPDYKGVCRIDYFSANLFHEIMSIGSILTSSTRKDAGLW